MALDLDVARARVEEARVLLDRRTQELRELVHEATCRSSTTMYRRTE